MMEASKLKVIVFSALQNSKENGYGEDMESYDLDYIACDIHNAEDEIPAQMDYRLLIPYIAQFKEEVGFLT